MSRVLTVQSLSVRPGPPSPVPSHYTLEVDLEVMLEGDVARTVVALVRYAGGREVECALAPEPEAQNERDVIGAFARRVAHDALCEGGEIPLVCSITFPLSVIRAYRFELRGDHGAGLLGWDDPEAHPPR